MKKKKNPISLNMALLGTTWKLRFFTSFLLIFISTSLCASENPSSETIIHNESSVESSQPTKPIVYIAEGTVVYGIESMSQDPTSPSLEKKKTETKIATRKVKSTSVVKKIAQKIKIEREIQKPEATTHISSHQSENSFEVSKQRYGVGTLTLNHYFKSAIVKNIAKIPSPLADNTNSSYEYYYSQKGIKVKFFCFTRPPPPFS